MIQLLAVFIGGGLGSLLRFAISKGSASVFQSNFPLGTFISNILACILLAVLVIFISNKTDQEVYKAFLITVFCGGFSTFSTFSFETLELFQSGNSLLAIANIVISLIVGIAVIYFILGKTNLI